MNDERPKNKPVKTSRIKNKPDLRKLIPEKGLDHYVNFKKTDFSSDDSTLLLVAVKKNDDGVDTKNLAVYLESNRQFFSEHLDNVYRISKNGFIRLKVSKNSNFTKKQLIKWMGKALSRDTTANEKSISDHEASNYVKNYPDKTDRIAQIIKDGKANLFINFGDNWIENAKNLHVAIIQKNKVDITAGDFCEYLINRQDKLQNELENNPTTVNDLELKLPFKRQIRKNTINRILETLKKAELTKESTLKRKAERPDDEKPRKKQKVSINSRNSKNKDASENESSEEKTEMSSESSANEFCRAMRHDSENSLLKLLENNSDAKEYINQFYEVDKPSLSPIMIATKRGFVKVVQALIEIGAEVDLIKSKNQNRRYTALYYAIQCGNLEIIECLLKNRAKVNILHDRLGSPLAYTIEHKGIKNRLEIIKLLIKYCARIYNIKRKDKKNWNAAELAKKTKNKEIINFFEKLEASYLEEPAIRDVKDYIKMLLYAIQQKDKKKRTLYLLEKFHQYKININAYFKYGAGLRTLLHFATKNGDAEIIIKLLELGADMNKNYAKNSAKETTPLIVLLNNGHDQNTICLVIDYCIKNNKINSSNVNIKTKQYGKSALFFAIVHNYFEAVKLLVEKAQADLGPLGNKNYEHYENPLAMAEAYKNETMIKYFKELDPSLIKPISNATKDFESNPSSTDIISPDEITEEYYYNEEGDSLTPDEFPTDSLQTLPVSDTLPMPLTQGASINSNTNSNNSSSNAKEKNDINVMNLDTAFHKENNEDDKEEEEDDKIKEKTKKKKKRSRNKHHKLSNRRKKRKTQKDEEVNEVETEDRSPQEISEIQQNQPNIISCMDIDFEVPSNNENISIHIKPDKTASPSSSTFTSILSRLNSNASNNHQNVAMENTVTNNSNLETEIKSEFSWKSNSKPTAHTSLGLFSSPNRPCSLNRKNTVSLSDSSDDSEIEVDEISISVNELHQFIINNADPDWNDGKLGLALFKHKNLREAHSPDCEKYYLKASKEALRDFLSSVETRSCGTISLAKLRKMSVAQAQKIFGTNYNEVKILYQKANEVHGEAEDAVVASESRDLNRQTKNTRKVILNKSSQNDETEEPAREKMNVAHRKK